MAMHRLLAFLAIGGAAASTAHARTQRQLPVEFGIPVPLPRGDRQLRGLGGGPEMPFERVAFGPIPMGAIPLGLPEDVEMQSLPVVDGPLRDLLDFGRVVGAAVLRPESMDAQPMQMHQMPRGLGNFGGGFGGPLELPMDTLHLKMQDHVPAPLSVDDSHGKVRIYGTLPKNLTAKTLKVSLSEGDQSTLLVEYFLGQGSQSGKQLVGIDERFDLDFEPVDQPAVKYKASTGAFELLLSRPVVKTRKPVAIDFDAASSTAAKPQHHPAVKPEHLAMAKPSKQSLKVVTQNAKPSGTSTAKVVLKRAKSMKAQRQPVPAQVSAKEFVHDSDLARLHASEVKTLEAIKKAEKQDMEGLSKVTKELHKVAQKQGPSFTNESKSIRVKNIANKAKQFVADAHLGDAQKELVSAFAPLDLGLVMLEMNHRVHSH